MRFTPTDDLVSRAFKQKNAQREAVLRDERRTAKYLKAERDFKYRKSDRIKKEFGRSLARSDRLVNRTANVSRRIFSGLNAPRPRIQNNNLSRQVLDDSFRLQTDITKRRNV